MLYPSLFIGLGTRGLEILQELQQLILEHYDRPSLPIFKFIAIETREKAEVKLPGGTKPEIQLIRPVITGTRAIKKAIKDGQKSYLKDWLKLEILDIPGSKFTDGASNIRMAGRLCLWENWTTIKREIDIAYDEINSREKIDETKDILRKRYEDIGKKIDDKLLVGFLPNIYIAGTLCGGTCSGMFIDISYYVKHQFGLWATNLPDPRIAKVIGVFTVYDATTLLQATAALSKIQAGNCWSALIEYDYWCHSLSEYKIIFPDGTEVKPTNEPPVDWMYLLSCTGNKTNYRRNGSPDLDTLEHVAAMVLFSETVGGLLDKKDEIRTDYRATNRVLQTDDEEHSTCIASCGVATVWYPKYRIAEAAACKYGITICNEWLKEISAETEGKIRGEAKREWKNILKDHNGELTSTAEGSLQGEVKQRFAEHKHGLLQKSPIELAVELRGAIRLCHKDNRYDREITMRREDFKKNLIDDLEDIIKRTINEQKNLPYAIYRLEHLDNAIEKEIRSLPRDFPDPDMSLTEGELTSDGFAKAVFKTKEVIMQKKEDLLEDCNKHIIQQIERIRDFRKRTILEEVREEIGIGKQMPQERRKAGERSIHQKLEAVRDILERSKKSFQERYGNLSKLHKISQDVIVLTEKGKLIRGDKSEGLEDDIDTLYAKINILSEKESILREIMKQAGKERLSDLLCYGSSGPSDKLSEEVKGFILAILRRHCLEKARETVNIPIMLRDKESFPITDTRSFASKGTPLAEITDGQRGLASKTLRIPPELIAGPGDIDSLEGELNDPTADDKIGFSRRLSDPELDYMLIFYQEEGLMFMDDNLSTAQLFEKRYKEAEKEKVSAYGLHTHKGGRAIFDPKIAKRRWIMERQLMPIALNIFSARDEKGKWIESEIFKPEKGRLVLRDKRKDGRDFVLTGDNEGIEKCAEIREIFEYFEKNVKSKTNEVGKKGFVERLNKYLAWVERKAEKEGKDPITERILAEEEIIKIKWIKEKYFAEEET